MSGLIGVAPATTAPPRRGGTGDHPELAGEDDFVLKHVRDIERVSLSRASTRQPEASFDAAVQSRSRVFVSSATRH